MQGLEAINAANGWAMALTGACIVMTGLATLSFIISQLHKFIGLLEGKKKPVAKTSAVETSPAPVESPAAADSLLEDITEAASIYQPLTAELGASFTLSQLYGLMESKNLPHPHITVRELRNAGHLVAVGEGAFAWKND